MQVTLPGLHSLVFLPLSQRDRLAYASRERERETVAWKDEHSRPSEPFKYPSILQKREIKSWGDCDTRTQLNLSSAKMHVRLMNPLGLSSVCPSVDVLSLFTGTTWPILFDMWLLSLSLSLFLSHCFQMNKDITFTRRNQRSFTMHRHSEREGERKQSQVSVQSYTGAQ